MPTRASWSGRCGCGCGCDWRARRGGWRSGPGRRVLVRAEGEGRQVRRTGPNSNRCSGGNAKDEYLTIKNYSRTTTVNLKGYVVKDATGSKFTFTARPPHPG